MRVFLPIAVLFGCVSTAVASPVSATVTITGNCTVYDYYADPKNTPLYSLDSPCGWFEGGGEIRPDGFRVSSFAYIGASTTTHVDIWTSMALEIVVLGGTGSGFIAGTHDHESLYIDFPAPATMTREWKLGGSSPYWDSYYNFMHPFTFGEPILITVDTHLSMNVSYPGSPGDFPLTNGFMWRMNITDIIGVDEHGHIIPEPLAGAYITEAAGIPEPSAGLLSGFGLLLLTWGLKRKRGCAAR